MTLRRGTQEVLAARMVPVGEPGWQDVLDVLTEAAKLAHPSVVEPLRRLLLYVDHAPSVPVGSWVVLDDGRLLSVADDAWVKLHCPEVVRAGPKPPKRCMFVWRDLDGWHQCERRRDETHGHTESRFLVMAPRGKYARCCLGLIEKDGPAAEPWVQQCGMKRRLCQQPHMFFAKTRLEEDA